jgi:hypothetical protein
MKNIPKKMSLNEIGALREHVESSRHSLISWKSILGGLFVTLIVYVALTALGAGIGGASASSAIQNDRMGNGFAVGGAIWIGVSAILALLLGCYFAARTSTFITGRIGAAQGLIISSLFFTFMIYGLGATLGAAGRGLGNIVGSIGMDAANVAVDPAMQGLLEREFGDVTFKSDSSVVAQGLNSRLLQGNPDSAKSYLKYQTGLSDAEINRRMARVENEMQGSMKNAAVKTAQAVSRAGWSLFFILFLGMVSSVIGGAFGASINFKRPLTEEQAAAHLTAHPVV